MHYVMNAEVEIQISGEGRKPADHKNEGRKGGDCAFAVARRDMDDSKNLQRSTRARPNDGTLL